MTHQLKRLVQYKQDGLRLDSHDDVPEDVRQELYALEQQRLERRSRSAKAQAGRVPPIHITNVLPHAGPTISEPPETLESRSMIRQTSTVETRRIKIPGMRMSGSENTAVGTSRAQAMMLRRCNMRGPAKYS